MRRPILAVFMALALVLAACGDDDDDAATDADDAATTTEAPAADDTTTTAAPTGGQAAPAVAAAATGLGDVLVDAEGFTLYVFDNDTPNSGTSSCTGGCLDNWPPAAAEEGFTVGEGLDQALFSTITRDDGSLQLAVNGRPLYRFAADTAAGQTNGQGVGGVWWAAGADGNAIQ
jgi:predicted lipoprotein with Yx(FWY)xxD motif